MHVLIQRDSPAWPACCAQLWRVRLSPDVTEAQERLMQNAQHLNYTGRR